MKLLYALLTTLAAAGGAWGQANCRACHMSDSPTREKPSLVRCPRGESKNRRSAAEAPAVLELGSGAGTYGPVKFPHKAHAEMTQMKGGCYRCHHYDQGGRIQRCAACHSSERVRSDLGKPDAKGAMHRLCVGCHREWSGSTDCAGCHGAKAAAFRHGRSMGWIENRFHGRLECGGCHAPAGKPSGAARDCESCHKGWQAKFDHAKTGLVLDETHAGLACADCHAAGFGAAPACAACHEKSYPKDRPGKRPGRK